MVGRKRKCDRPDIRPSDRVKKCLFGKPDKAEKEEELRRYEQENLSNLERMKFKYGYDFVEDKHIQTENAQYTVVKVIEGSFKKDLNGVVSSTSNANFEKQSTELTSCTPNKNDSDNNSRVFNERPVRNCTSETGKI